MTGYNPFHEYETRSGADEKWVAQALEGNRDALEEIIRRHQNWIYNISLRMLMDPQDAEDATQEVLIKIVTKLSTFKGRSQFRTWVYRIVANHVLNMKKSASEKKYFGFTRYGRLIDNVADGDIPDRKSLPVEISLVLEEVKIDCMMAMILCLSRKQRFIFVLGEIFGIPDSLGGEIMDISRDNYRQRLSRARKKVFGFMRETCGLVDPGNGCQCQNKLSALIKRKVIDPANLRFASKDRVQINSMFAGKVSHLRNFFDKRCRHLFRGHPFMNSPDFVRSFRKMLTSTELQEIFDFSDWVS